MKLKNVHWSREARIFDEIHLQEPLRVVAVQFDMPGKWRPLDKMLVSLN